MILRLKVKPLIRLAPINTRVWYCLILACDFHSISTMSKKRHREQSYLQIYIRQAVKGHLPINLYINVFDTQIRPILEYASEIWCPRTLIEDLERVHFKFLMSILGVSQSSPTAAIFGETGRFPLHMRQQDRALKFWIRINKLSPTNQLYKIHNELLQLARQGHDTWAGRVENVIRKYTTDLPSHNAMPLDNKAIDALGNKLRVLRYNQFICKWKMDLQQQINCQNWILMKLLKATIESSPIYFMCRTRGISEL